MVRISEISKEQMHVWWENCRQRNLTTKDSLPCPICGSESKTGYDYGPECVHFMGCGHIIRIKQELPSIEQCSSWIYARLPAEVSRQKISDAILWAEMATVLGVRCPSPSHRIACSFAFSAGDAK